MIDRGFVKWQPFNSLISNKTILNNLKEKHNIAKPTLFPEEIENITKAIIEAYYFKSLITLIYYENNYYKKITTFIIKINSSYQTLKFKNGKVINFNQILHVLPN